MNVMELISSIGILPVINITDITTARPLATALVRGGVPVIEVTLRNEESLNAIREILDEQPDMKVLAGTILSIEQAQSALDAGASGLVMPGYDDEIIDFAISKGVPIVPGCTDSADIQRGIKKGLSVFKFFPAELSGGIKTLKFLSGPFKSVKFLPTGGMYLSNIGEYLREKYIIACGGSYMATSEMIKNRDFDLITENCKKAVDISLGFELAHIGINHDDESGAVSTAETVSSIFGFAPRYMNSAVFAGTAVEAVKHQGAGEKGHIGFYTNSIERALAYFEKKGIAIDEANIKRNANGKITCFYLKDEIAGFAFHVVER